LSALRVQRDYIESQHNNSGTAYLQLFRIWISLSLSIAWNIRTRDTHQT
jgi:hypothetical protein